MEQVSVKNVLARRSIRKYTMQPCSIENIKTLLEAAMAAPSAGNRQPWCFVVVTQREKLDKLADMHDNGKMLFEAPLCIAVCADMTKTLEGEAHDLWIQDCSAATENILLAVTGLGLGAVWLGIHPRNARKKAVSEILSIPEEIVPFCLISIGYPAEVKEPRTQYDEALVHYEQW